MSRKEARAAPPEVIGPATAIRRFIELDGGKITSRELKDMTSDER